MRPLKSLTLEALLHLLATRFGAVDDDRVAEQCRYGLSDTLMSGFAMMFFQHPSLLQFQRAMEKKRQRCNLQTIFGVHELPSDTQMRDILDGVEVESLRELLPQLWEKVRRAGWAGASPPYCPVGNTRGRTIPWPWTAVNISAPRKCNVRIVYASPIAKAECTIRI
jgi:hypothetical protein